MMTYANLLAALLLGSAALAQADDGQAVARVNGAEIGEFRLERYFNDYLEAQGRSIGAIRNPNLYKRLRRAALDELIDKELLWQEARRRGLVADEAAVQQQFQATRAAFRDEQRFAERLAEDGFDEASYTEYLRREQVSQRMLAELSQPKPPTEEEVRRFFEENRARLERPEQVHARHILLKIEPGQDAAEVEQRILALRGEILAGADFAEEARKHSRDSSAASGGDLGFFARGSMQPPFEEAAFALQPGETSMPVQTVYGWHLIRLEGRQPAEPIEESQGLAIVRDYLAEQNRSRASEEALQRLRDASRIELARGQ
ncbi:Foldase protein PrsA 2 [compost metagenome]